MIILAISENVHDASVCILRDGRLVSALSAERITRVKKDSKLPQEVTYFAALQAGISLDEIDYVVCATCGHDPEDYNNFSPDINNFKSRDFYISPEIVVKGYYIPHHVCHAAAAYYTSNFDEAVSFTLDCCSFVYPICKKLNSLYAHFKGNKLVSVKYPDCYDGVRYAKVTDYTGFTPCLERAGTLMGLSSYGKYKEVYEEAYNSLTEHSSIFPAYHEFNRFPNYTENLKDAMDCAKTTQVLFENSLLEHVKDLRKSLGAEHVNNLCLAGGSFLNCNANSKIVTSNEYENVHLFPGCGDDGLCVGAAHFWAHHVLDLPRHNYKPQDLCYTGPNYPKYKDIDHAYIAKQISEGKVVGLMNGRSEFGPRALGNRSILADPRNQHVRDWINQIIKKREWFRPFAPMVLEEEYQDWFDFPNPSPFMLFTAPVKQPEKIPAVTHVDGSARFQTVSEESNPDMYKILQEFKKITGIPVLLNTSLNGKGEPILEYESHGEQFFHQTEIDMMVIFGKVLEK